MAITNERIQDRRAELLFMQRKISEYLARLYEIEGELADATMAGTNVPKHDTLDRMPATA